MIRLALTAFLGIALVGSPAFCLGSSGSTESQDQKDKENEKEKEKAKDGAKDQQADNKEAKADAKTAPADKQQRGGDSARGSGSNSQESPEAKKVAEKIRENPEQYMKMLDPKNQNADQMLAKVPITRERLEKILKEEGIKLPGGLKVKTAGDPKGELAGTVFTGKDQPELKPEDMKDMEERLGKGKRLLMVSGEEKELSRSGPRGVLRSLGKVNSAAGSSEAPIRVVAGSGETASYAKYFRENPSEARELSKRVGIVDIGQNPGQDAYRSAFRNLIPDSRKLADRFAAKPLKTLGQQGLGGDGSTTPRSTGKHDGSTPKSYDRGRVAVGALPEANPPTPNEKGTRAAVQAIGSWQKAESARSAMEAAVRAVAPPGRKQAIARMVAEAAAKVGIPVPWALGIAKAENNFTERRAKDGGVGVMQVMPKTARDIIRKAREKINIHTTAGNIRAGTLYLKTMYDKYKGNLTLATAAYNGGPGGAKRYANGRPHPITKRYVPRVLGYMKEAISGMGKNLLSGTAALAKVFDGSNGSGVAHASPSGKIPGFKAGPVKDLPAANRPGDGSTPRSSPRQGGSAPEQAGRAPAQAEGAAAPVAGLGGLPVVSREGWGSKYKYKNPKVHFERITVHHEAKYASPNMTAAQEAAEVRSVERQHRGKQRWSGSYNYMIAPSGRIYELSGERQGVHSKHNNPNNLGIALMGNFQQQKPTQAQLNSYAALAAYKAVQYGIPQSKWSWHGKLPRAATECPGKYLIARLPETNEVVQAEVEMLKEMAKKDGFTPVLVKQPLP